MSAFVDVWADWSERCVSPAITPANLIALRCAFYCGALGWAGLHQKVMEAEKVSDLTRALMLENLWHELHAFTEEFIVIAALKTQVGQQS